MPVVKIDLAAEFTGKKEFSKAEKATAGLSRSVKQLGAAFGLTFGARALANYGKGAVKAFAADEKAARSLALQLKNTGNAFAAPQVEGFIANLQKTTGILDDDLRPAFRTLLTATGDVAKSQKALNLALDISAGTGKDLGAVSMALAKGFGGQTTALSRLGAGLDKATLASGDMDRITSILTAKFQGQAKEAVKGYAGQMALLTVATENSKEIIGEGLLDALTSIGKDNSVADLASDMESIATQTANVIRGIGVLIAKIKSIPGLSTLSKLVGETSLAGQALGALGKMGAQSKTQKGYGSSNTLENFVAAGGVIKKNTIAIKDNTKTVIAKTQLDKLSAKFDVERIGLYAALAKATTEEEKARILAKIAIVESNEAAATALNKLSFAAKSATDAFTRYADNATIVIGQGQYAIQAPQGFAPNQMSNAAPMPATNMPVNPSGNNEITIGQGQYAIQAPSGFTAPVINVQVQVGGQDVAAIVSSGQEVESQSGGSGGSWRSVRVM
jgi:hypothetical protein